MRDDVWRAAEEEADWLRRTRDVPEQRHGEPMPERRTITWLEWYATAPTIQPVACAVTGCDRQSLIFVSPWASVCLDCWRALLAHTNGGQNAIPND